LNPFQQLELVHVGEELFNFGDERIRKRKAGRVGARGVLNFNSQEFKSACNKEKHGLFILGGMSNVPSTTRSI
jgi:hypothetical protein